MEWLWTLKKVIYLPRIENRKQSSSFCVCYGIEQVSSSPISTVNVRADINFILSCFLTLYKQTVGVR